MIMEFTYYPYTEKNVNKVEERWGVYKLAGRSKRVLFLGRGNVRKHLAKHLPEGKTPAEEAEYFSIEYYDTGEEAYEAWEEQMREFKDKFGKWPKYNKPLD
jgi:hypothetical protein